MVFQLNILKKIEFYALNSLNGQYRINQERTISCKRKLTIFEFWNFFKILKKYILKHPSRSLLSKEHRIRNVSVRHKVVTIKIGGVNSIFFYSWVTFQLHLSYLIFFSNNNCDLAYYSNFLFLEQNSIFLILNDASKYAQFKFFRYNEYCTDFLKTNF